MSKLVMFVVSLVLFYPLAFFLSKYLPYYIHELKQPPTLSTVTPSVRNSTVKTSERLVYLEELTLLPLVGQLFL
jgi:hypothetical protein